MLCEQDRAFLRLASLVVGASVAELRNMILNGYMQGPAGPERDLNYQGALGSREVRPELTTAFRLHVGAGSAEDALDMLCVLWIAEMRCQVMDEKDQRGWEDHVESLGGGPGDWWP